MKEMLCPDVLPEHGIARFIPEDQDLHDGLAHFCGFIEQNNSDYKITENKEVGKYPAIVTTRLINDANMKS